MTPDPDKQTVAAEILGRIEDARESGRPPGPLPTLEMIQANVRLGGALVDALVQIAELEALVRHCWVHSGHQDCGYDQMERRLRAIYCQVIRRTGPPNYEPPEPE